jgi:hypothetical protein
LTRLIVLVIHANVADSAITADSATEMMVAKRRLLFLVLFMVDLLSLH